MFLETLTFRFTPACWQLYHLLIYGFALQLTLQRMFKTNSGEIEMDIELETYVEQVMNEQNN